MSIVFTDIHNSSKLWRKYGNIMFNTLTKHDKIIKDQVILNKYSISYGLYLDCK